VDRAKLARSLVIAAILAQLAAPAYSPARPEFQTSGGSPLGQDYPGQKPKYDYMSTFLSRSTKPLGLKEDLLMKRLLRQPRASWAIRVGVRHILD